MRFISETTSNGVSERLFTLDDIPGVLWSPADAAGSHPLVLLGHGGGQHKKAQGLVARAHRYVTVCGFAVAAIDAPGHGDRPRSEQDERSVAGIRDRVAAGDPLGPQIARYNAALAARAVPEWQATLDALQALDCAGAGGQVGFWGVSMGSGIGVALVAAGPRITAAVFGLAGGRIGQDRDAGSNHVESSARPCPHAWRINGLWGGGNSTQERGGLRPVFAQHRGFARCCS